MSNNKQNYVKLDLTDMKIFSASKNMIKSNSNLENGGKITNHISDKGLSDILDNVIRISYNSKVKSH